MEPPIKTSRRGKAAPAIFANPAAEAISAAPVAVPFIKPATPVAAMTDPAAVAAIVDRIAVPAIGETADRATETLDHVEETSIAAIEATSPPAEVIEAVETVAHTSEEFAERAMETIAAQPTDIVSQFLKGSFPMATIFDTSKTQDMMGDMSTRAKGAMEKSVKMTEEMTEFTKGNVEAIVASGRVAVKGIEAMAQDAAETAKAGFEHAQTALKSMTQVKSPTELFQLQSDYAKSAFDQLVANASKASEQMMKLAGDIAQPLSNRYALASDKVKSTAL